MSKMLEVWKKMEKLYGRKGNIDLHPVETIFSGSYSLDEAIGNGLPKGRIIQYAGKESSGKTLMSLIAIREWQKLNDKNWAVFIDAEDTFDSVWANTIGVDLERLYLIKSNEGIEIWSELCGVPHKEFGKPKLKQGILDMEIEEPSGLGIIVLDSIAAVKTPIESTKSVGNTNIAPMGRFMPDALRRLTPLLARTGIIFIGINQVRVDMGKMFGDPTTTPGGKALKHACSVMVHFVAPENKDYVFIDEINGKKIGHICKARIDKNKVGFPFGRCEFELYYHQGVVNEHKEIGNLAVQYKIVQKPNNRSYDYNGMKWSGKESFFNGILENKLCEELLEKIKNESGKIKVKLGSENDVLGEEKYNSQDDQDDQDKS